eukprot:1454114-Prymnesium_polylepis.1
MVCDKPLTPLGRAWCLYETVTWLYSGKKTKDQCTRARPAVYVSHGTADAETRAYTPISEPDAVAAVVDAIDLDKAHTSLAADKRHIHKLVKERIMGGAQPLNAPFSACFE